MKPAVLELCDLLKTMAEDLYDINLSYAELPEVTKEEDLCFFIKQLQFCIDFHKTCSVE
jgi:hypothetical protein